MNKPSGEDKPTNKQQEPFEVGTAQPEHSEPTESKQCSVGEWIFWGVSIAAIATAAYFGWKWLKDSPENRQKLLDFLESMKPNNFRNYMITLGIIFACQFLFFPGQSTLLTIQAYFIQDFFQSWIRFVLILWPIKFFGFIIIKYVLYERVYQRMKHNDIYQAINYESKTNAWAVSAMMNFMFLVSALKMYMIPMLSINLLQFTTFMVFAEALYAAVFSFIGLQIRDIQAFFSGTSAPSTTSQKYSYIVFAVMTIFTVAVMFIVGYKVTQRVKEIQEEHNRKLAARAEADPLLA